MDIQRLRNITTGRLHTKMQDIYEDLEFFTRGGGIMTHMIPRVMLAIEPWLREKVKDARFWDGQYDVTHTGDFPIEAPTEAESAAALERYSQMPNPLEGKQVIPIMVSATLSESKEAKP